LKTGTEQQQSTAPSQVAFGGVAGDRRWTTNQS
jgi:hypothetical protein